MVAIPELDGAIAPDGVRRPLRRRRQALHRMRAALRPSPDARGAADAVLPGTRRRPGRPRRQAGRPAPHRPQGPQGRDRPLQLPAQRRRCRLGGLPRGLRLPPQHPEIPGRRRLSRRGSGVRRGPAPQPDRGQLRPFRHRRQCPLPGLGRRPDPPPARARRDRKPVGSRPGQGAQRRPVGVHPRTATRQRLHRPPAGLRLRGRSDAAALREGLRPDPRLRRLLPLPARGVRRRRRAALRHPRRAGIHARQAGRPRRRLLAGAPDRRPAQLLPLRRQQPLGRRAGQAPLRRDPDQLPDAAGRQGRALPRPARPQGHHPALARDVARSPRRAGRSGGPHRASRPPPSILPARRRRGHRGNRPRGREDPDPHRPARGRRSAEPRRTGRAARRHGRRRRRGNPRPPRHHRHRRGSLPARRRRPERPEVHPRQRRDAGRPAEARRPARGGPRTRRHPPRPGRRLHPPRPWRRRGAHPRGPAHGPQPQRLRSLPHPQRLRHARRRPSGPAAARPPSGRHRRPARIRSPWCCGDRTI